MKPGDYVRPIDYRKQELGDRVFKVEALFDREFCEKTGHEYSQYCEGWLWIPEANKLSGCSERNCMNPDGFELDPISNFNNLLNEYYKET